MEPRTVVRRRSPTRVVQSARNSAGDPYPPSSYDTYYTQPRSGRDSISDPRANADRLLGPRVVQRTLREPVPARRAYDDYEVGPRRLTPIDTFARRPLSSVGVESAHRDRAPIAIPVGETIIIPATSRRDERRFSVSNSEADRYSGTVATRPARESPSGYRVAGTRTGHYSESLESRMVNSRSNRDDQYERIDHEYAQRRQPAYPEVVARVPPRRDSESLVLRERPRSIAGYDDYQLKPRGSIAREVGPPVTTRGFDKLDAGREVRQEYRQARQPDRPRASSPPRKREEVEGIHRRRSLKAPVSLHHELDDGYSSLQDDRSAGKHRRRPSRSENVDVRDDVRGTVRNNVRDAELLRPPEDRSRKSTDSRGSRDASPERPRRHHHRADSESRRTQRRDDSKDRNDKQRSRRHRERDDDSDRDDRQKGRSDHSRFEDLALGAAGLAATGLVAEKVKHRHRDNQDSVSDVSSRDQYRKKDSDERVRDPQPKERRQDNDESDEERKERRRRRRKEREERAALEQREEMEQQEASEKSGGTRGVRIAEEDIARKSSRRSDMKEDERQNEPGITDTNSEEERRERRRRRRKEREAAELAQRAQKDGRNDSDTADGEGRSAPDRHSAKVVGGIAAGAAGAAGLAFVADAVEKKRHRRRKHETSGSSSSSNSDVEQPRRRRDRSENRARFADSGTEKENEVKPRGILRAPTQKFPEDPAAIREGVAPLKEAGKKGIPVNARWTKINRSLVNPEALEQAQERFEERVDHVIVLRVLSKEEIEKFALKTQEIRDKRYKERQLQDLEDAESQYSRGPPPAIADQAYNDSDSGYATQNNQENYSDHDREAPLALPPPEAPMPIPGSLPTNSQTPAQYMAEVAGKSYSHDAEPAYAMATSNVPSLDTQPQASFNPAYEDPYAPRVSSSAQPQYQA